MTELRAEQHLFPSVPFQKGKPAHQPASEEEEEKSDDNDTMRVSSLLYPIHCNPAIFFSTCLHFFFFFPLYGDRAQRTFLRQSKTKNRRMTPTPT